MTVVAIDGPSASGKSTVSRRVAAELDMLYVDSGALYRGVTFAAMKAGADTNDAAAVVDAMNSARFEFFVRDGGVRFSIDGVEPDMELRTAELNHHVSPVAAVPEVRRQVTEWLRLMTGYGDLVMEGRDIGTAVFPGTEHKFYLDASAEERARRRHSETEGTGHESSVDRINESLKRRDRIDSTRSADPLKVAAGACILDSTTMTVEEVTSAILNKIRGL
ncbi:MAG: (d)CMP kinase [Kiritimatiellia bacterium]|jgi:cytidylate kinase|nr:(d)CMP kinase [Kiritimatiellia bacterium]